MPSGRSRGNFRLSLIIMIIVAGAFLLSILFYTFWQRLNRQVEVILQEQFNQQQLFLSKKIADNVESYFDFLENALMGYAGFFQTTPPEAREMDAALQERFSRHQRFGIIEIRRYNAAGVGVQVFSTAPHPPPAPVVLLCRPLSRLGQRSGEPGPVIPEQDLRVPRGSLERPEAHAVFVPTLLAGTQLKFGGDGGVSRRPLLYLQRVTADVRSGQTGYAWIIDQDGVFLAHYEKDFVGQDAIKVRIDRNPNIRFTGLREIQADILLGKEGPGNIPPAGTVSTWGRPPSWWLIPPSGLTRA